MDSIYNTTSLKEGDNSNNTLTSLVTLDTKCYQVRRAGPLKICCA